MSTFRYKLDDALCMLETMTPTTSHKMVGVDTDDYIPAKAPHTGQANQRTVITGPVHPGASTISRFLLKPLNPFYSDHSTFGGTVDFIAPETISARGRFDDDLVTSLYMVLKSTNQRLAALWRPVVIWFRRYEIACMELLYRNPVQEDISLADKLDTVSLNDVVAGARAIRDTLSGMDSPLLQNIKMMFDRFYSTLSQIAPIIRKSLGGGRLPYFGHVGLRSQIRRDQPRQVASDEVDLGKLHPNKIPVQDPGKPISKTLKIEM